MSRIHELGRAGEALAADALVARGWVILDRNWRDGPRELDLVAYRGGILAIVEVKTRRSLAWGDPLESISPRKRRELERAARSWVARERHRVPVPFRVRFDAASVLAPAGAPPTVYVVEDAWPPSG